MPIMKNNNKNKIKEPFPAENTPAPPQIIDPNLRNERNEQPAPVEGNKKPGNEPADSGKRLGDPLEIDDETTI
jgi:hypothetical protein